MGADIALCAKCVRHAFEHCALYMRSFCFLLQAKAEERIAGFNPWHFGHRSAPQNTAAHDMELGAVEMPTVLAKLRQIGEYIVAAKTPPPVASSIQQSPNQRAIVAAIRPRAVAASTRATPQLLRELDSRPFRTELGRQLAGTGEAALAAAQSQVLLERLRAEASASEMVHNLAIWSAEDPASERRCAPCDCGWACGSDTMNAPRTPVFDRPQLDNLWMLGVEMRPGNGSVYVPPDTIVGWLWAAETYELAGLGCDPFTSSVSGALPSGATAAAFPASIAEAAERPVYTILDLKKVDVGAAEFGPIGLVFNTTQVSEATIFTPLDTGEWSYECNVTNQGRLNTTRCCINRPLVSSPDEPCELCATNAECCQAEHSFLNCSAWAEFENAPGVAGHIDHILLAAARAWNDTITVDNFTTLRYNTAVNLASMLARSVATASNSENATGPQLLPHSNYYIEANIFANPHYDSKRGDVLFVIAQFVWLFGTQRGREVQAWAVKWGLPIVWGLGPTGCYERVNQTGGACDPDDPIGAEHAYRASSRFLDPVSCARATDSRAAAAPSVAKTFDRVWATASASRVAGTWNASVAWRELINATEQDLRVSPVSAGRCDEGDALGVTTMGECVRRRATPGAALETDNDDDADRERARK